MATWTTDIAGTGLAHHQPTKQERTLARRIARRWHEWHPLLTHELRSRPHPPGYVARELLRLERAHAKAVVHLLESGVRWMRVSKRRLDDPRWSDDERAFHIAHPRLPKPRPPLLTRQEKAARRDARRQIREAEGHRLAEVSRLARGLTPDRSVARFIGERFPEEYDV